MACHWSDTKGSAKFFALTGLDDDAMAEQMDWDHLEPGPDDPEGFDFAIAGGIGYNSPFGLTIDLRYKQGLIDVFGRNVDTGNGVDTIDVDDLVLNKGFQLSFGYLFDL